MSENDQATFDDFLKVDIRVGKIIAVNEFPQARKPAWKLKIDFGEKIGVKKSSAQIVANYSADELLGKQVLAVVNFPPRQIGPFMSEVLTLGFEDGDGNVTLASIDKEVPLVGVCTSAYFILVEPQSHAGHPAGYYIN